MAPRLAVDSNRLVCPCASGGALAILPRSRDNGMKTRCQNGNEISNCAGVAAQAVTSEVRPENFVATHFCADHVQKGIGAEQFARQKDEFLGRNIKMHGQRRF
jgi:hypothetical protein